LFTAIGWGRVTEIEVELTLAETIRATG